MNRKALRLLGRSIRKLRRSNGKTMGDVARETGVRVTVVSAVETGDSDDLDAYEKCLLEAIRNGK